MMARSLAAEFAKLKRSKMILWTLLALLAYAALTLAVAPYLGSDAGQTGLKDAGGIWQQATEQGVFDDTWAAGLKQEPRFIAGGLVLLIFALVTAYVFGREFKEGTAVQSLTAPLRREYLTLSKLAVIAVWLLAWTALSMLVHIIDLAILQEGFAGLAARDLWAATGDTFLAAFMLYLTLPLFAWMAVWGKGYLRPMLAAVTITGMSSAIINTEFSPYFPWNMPVHVVGASWMPIPPSGLVPASWLVLVAVFVIGVAGTIWQLNRADTA